MIAVFERGVGTAVALAYGPVALAASVVWAVAAGLAGRWAARPRVAGVGDAEKSVTVSSDSADAVR